MDASGLTASRILIASTSNREPALTEIPEHLLKRSRAAKGKPESGTADSSSQAVTPASEAAPAQAGPPALVAAAAATPPDPEPAEAAPVAHYIKAANQRKRVPGWAFVVIGTLPLWAVSFAGTMQLQEVEDPLFIEAETTYVESGGCAGCHGAAGGGGVGYKLSEGTVVDTFPSPIDQMVHVARGSAAIIDQPYGNPDRAGGVRVSGARGTAMPGQLGTLTLTELELVVFHERAVLSGEATTSEAYQEWMESMREAVESGEGEVLTEELLNDLLLACANPEFTPGATGAGSVDGNGDNNCPGPHGPISEEDVASG